MTSLALYRKLIFRRVLYALMSLLILNYSIDPPDASANVEDLGVNEIESIAELAIEEMLNIENYFPEAEDSDIPQTKGQSASLFVAEPIIAFETAGAWGVTIKSIFYHNCDLLEGMNDLSSPPPKA